MKHVKKIFVMAALCFSQLAGAYEVNQADIKSIESMAGCYAVDFSFFEIQALENDHALKAPYLTGAYEYIALEKNFDQENPTIVLQHILDFGRGVQKHWRQDWTFGEVDFLNYKGVSFSEGAVLHTWQKQSQNSETWTQQVFGVGDEPRYSCSAEWEHAKYSSSWKCRTWTPLPRRDYKNGYYYQTMDRGNHVLTSNHGWRHVQNNTKIKLEQGKEIPIIEEVGVNSYVKVDDSHCATASAWWKENKKGWSDVRNAWEVIFKDVEYGGTLSIFDQIADKPLYEHLMTASQAENKQQQATDAIVNYIYEH